jgi:glutathione reductase (NADPH)
LIEFKEKLNEGISERHEKKFDASGIDMYHGFVTFSDTHEVTIGNKKISTRNILIATGSKPHAIGIPGEEYLVSSDQLLSLKRLPSRILFVGAGYISMEFSHVLAASGAHVTLLEYAPSPLMKFDRDLVTMLVKESKNHGIEIWASRKVTKIEKVGNEFSVITEGESEKVFKADLIAHGAGRIPNIENLKLENADINYEKYRIKVNQYLQSISNKNVYVAGDAHAEGIQLTPAAEMEGKIVAYNMLHGNAIIPDYTAIPSIVFTHPGLAAVGESANSTNQSENTEIIFKDTSAKHITKRLGLTASAFKVIVDKTTRRVLGAHMLGHNVDEVINHFALIIRTGKKIETIKDMP